EKRCRGACAKRLILVSVLDTSTATTSALDARTSASGIAGVFYRASFWLDFSDPGAALHFHDLIAQERGPFELQIGRRHLHFFLKLAQQFGEIEIAAGFLDDRGGNFASAQNGVQTFLDRAPHCLRRDPVFLVVLHLLGAAIF